MAQFSQRDCRWTGPIILETVIDTQGRIESLRFLKKQPPECIEQPIRDSLRTWQFKPAELNGEPVSVYYMLTVNIHWQ
ncbi:MAG: energy transducer TonB [Acidobacteriota bacterium]|nr:energy transducer TonB [Acidobacteriota bacterium]